MGFRVLGLGFRVLGFRVEGFEGKGLGLWLSHRPHMGGLKTCGMLYCIIITIQESMKCPKGPLSNSATKLGMAPFTMQQKSLSR